jgi:hypothetical protein
VPPAGVLRRERRGLLEFREERLRDLGGLLLEMFRRNRFREDLIRERCEELITVDEHLATIDALLGVTWTVPEPLRCACGATLADNAHFCAACGRAIGEASRPCSTCGHALPADAVHCLRCGAEVASGRPARRPQQPSLPVDPASEFAEGP